MCECAAIFPTAMLELSVVHHKCLPSPHQFCFNKIRKISQFMLFSNVSVTRQQWHIGVCVCALCMYESLIKANNKITQLSPRRLHLFPLSPAGRTGLLLPSWALKMDLVRVDNGAEWSVCTVEMQRVERKRFAARCGSLVAQTEDVETLERSSRCLFETVVDAAASSSF